MNFCKYCGQSKTKLDNHGYCRKYNCIERSGMKAKLEHFVKEISKVYYIPDTYGNVGRVVSNPYSHRHRFIDNVINDAKIAFGGFVPLEILQKVPMKYKGKSWDANIRW